MCNCSKKYSTGSGLPQKEKMYQDMLRRTHLNNSIADQPVCTICGKILEKDSCFSYSGPICSKILFHGDCLGVDRTGEVDMIAFHRGKLCTVKQHGFYGIEVDNAYYGRLPNNERDDYSYHICKSSDIFICNDCDIQSEPEVKRVYLYNGFHRAKGALRHAHL